MAVQQQVKASGMTGADEAAREEAKSLLAPLEPSDTELALPGGATTRPEDVHTSMTPAFTRMRTDFNSPDREVVDQMRRAVDLLIQKHFAEVFDIFYQIYELVREQEVDTSTGHVKTDEHGLPVWRRSPTGAYIEDWSKMTVAERERFLYQLTIGLFRWEQAAADLWGEAMFGRAQFEESFSHGFEELNGDRPTIDDRTARARIRAAEHRYRSVYLSYLSRRADAVVRSAERLAQRIKDVHLS